MLFPFYFRLKADKIDVKRHSGGDWRNPLKGVRIHPRSLFTLAFDANNKDHGNNRDFTPHSFKMPRAIFVDVWNP